MATFTESFPTDGQAIAADLDRTGWVCLENAISPDWLTRAQDYVRGLLETHGQRFFVIVRPADVQNSLASEIAHHPLMQSLLRKVVEIGCPQGIVEGDDVYNTLRVVAGPDGCKGSREFHYDADVVTALVPIFIPDDDRASGELVVFPNKRGYRNLLTNLIEKALVQSRPYRRMMVRKAEQNHDANFRFLKPGNIYLFWGYRTYHGNMPCKSNMLRATMLLHYGNPHGKNALLEAFRNVHKLIEQRRITRRKLPVRGWARR